METIAVYFEPVAKSYGVHSVTDVRLVQSSMPAGAGARYPRGIPTSFSEAGRFSFVMLQYDPSGEARLHAVARPEEIAGVLGAFGLSEGPDVLIRPVDLLFFQGPHFYERYGIAASAVAKLREKKSEMLAAGFSGSMAYMIVPHGTAEGVQAALAECFRLP